MNKPIDGLGGCRGILAAIGLTLLAALVIALLIVAVTR